MPALTKPYILIVDDNPFNRELISEVADSEGFLIKEAKDGREALVEIANTCFNLVVLDLLMPGMDGFETAKKIRAMGINTPVVAVSALTLKQDIQRSLRAGCNEFLPKPVNVKKLRSILQKYAKISPQDENITLLRPGECSLISSSAHIFKGLFLILIEENENLRKIYADFLTRAGFSVQGLGNGSDAVEFINDPDNTVHIIISNIFTSGIDGLGLLTIVKRKFAHILVFLYTELYDTSTFQYAVQQKVDGIIPQDQFQTTALEIIESALSQSRSKGSRISEARTAKMVSEAQAQLIQPGCINLCPSLDIAYQPLHEAGGDMMRCHRFDMDGRCGIVLADVAGHDIMASYTSATFTGILMSVWDSHKDPMELIKKINLELIKIGNDKSHICATAIVWDRLSGNLQIACAGNPGGLMASFTSDGRTISTTYKDLPGGGMVLGAIENNDLFISGGEKLKQNDYLFLFSDGMERQDLINAVEDKLELFNTMDIKNTYTKSTDIKTINKNSTEGNRAKGNRADGSGTDGNRMNIRGICQHLVDTIAEKKKPEDDMILLCIHDDKQGSQMNQSDFHCEFLSTYEEVDRACIWIDQKLTLDNIPEGNDKDLVLLSIREAILNAVEHGNNHKPSAHFEVDIYFKNPDYKSCEHKDCNLNDFNLKDHDFKNRQLKGRELRVKISDEGTGFNFKKNMRKLEDLTITQIGKRGLSLMDSIAHKIIVQGGTITLIFSMKIS